MLRVVSLIIAAVQIGVLAPAHAAQQDDIRVLIDVSGSMVQTDPYNLRVPAVRMLNGLIPTGSKAGIWTFGRYVNMEVKWGPVNEQWRKQADRGAEKIHSRAQFTNIESALSRATKSWSKPDPATRRSIILLTDGKVDVAKSPAKNTESRHRLLQDIVPRLAANGVNVHAIGLSRHTDEQLLKRLAVESGGSFEIADTAKDLQRIFLHMFERAAQPDSVALRDNRFTIDNSVREMTLLVFRKTDRPVQLVRPDQQLIRQARHGEDVRWRHDEGYDLITVTTPTPGEWQLDADIDEDNRVMIVTDLKLVVDDLPAYITPDQDLELKVELHDKDNKIDKNSFLKFVDFQLVHRVGDDSKTIPLQLMKSRDIKDKGIYLHRFDQPLVEGLHQLVVSADARTFSRSKRISMNVQWPIDIQTESTGEPGRFQLKIKPLQEFMQADSMRIEATLKAPDGQVEPLAMAIQGDLWLGDIDATAHTGLYALDIKVSGRTQSGEKIQHTRSDITVLGMQVVDQTTPGDEWEPPVAPVELVEQPPADQDSSLLMSMVMIGIFNLLLLAIGGGVFYFLRRKRKRDEIDLMDDELEAQNA